jgi:hypothetical protein
MVYSNLPEPYRSEYQRDLNGCANTDADMDKPDDFDAALAVTRLLVGGTVEGTFQLLQRLHDWEQLVRDDVQAETIESEADRLRYALVGFIFDAQLQMRRRMAGLQAQSESLTKALKPITDSWWLRPIKKQYDALQTQIDEWAEIGRHEEALSRAIASEGMSEIIDEFLQYLSENPEVKEMVQQQSADLASDVIGSVREASVSADAVLERVVRSIFLRRPREELSRSPYGKDGR